ncbi:hypothetical protein HCU64_09850 [Methylobacterium sp. C25]|uniref:hypothetical protein n=1 Tax=Methylobacterium sp. C25 TaxID=2721622 RepID=UPI001F1C8F39|nr:hypothetical protein [Methylobacterium sp. C25]MCE4224054.1 hypothetical protein [Methylobacterium sp. C25]
MRMFAAALATALRAVILIPALVWEGGRWILRSVARPDPVLPATGAAADYLDAAAAAPSNEAHVAGTRAIHPVGMTMVLHARHIAFGEPAVDLSVLPDNVLVWLESLSEAEVARLAVTMPHRAEALARGEDVEDLPSLHRDMSARAADVSEPEQDEADEIYSWPHTDEKADQAMRDLFKHVERQHRRRRAA